MKKCPHCAEEVRDEAVKCKHCQSSLSAPQEAPSADSSERNAHKSTQSSRGDIQSILSSPYARASLWFLYFVFAFSVWVGSPIAGLIFILPVIWHMGYGTDQRGVKERIKTWRKQPLRIVLSVCLILFSLPLIIYNTQDATRAQREAAQQRIADQAPAPIIELLSEQGNLGAISDYTLQFKVANTDSVEVNRNTLTPNEDGVYELQATLEDPSTTFTILAKNTYKQTKREVDVIRALTDEEEAEAAERERQRELAAEEARRKEEAEQRAWEQSKAGRICNTDPTWSKETCEKLADGEVWIGMTYDMLVAQRGKPSSANPSNYGYGTQWQWCWSWNYSPNCFYDGNDDKVIDSYN